MGLGGRGEDLPGGERGDGDRVLQHDLGAGTLSCGAEGKAVSASVSSKSTEIAFYAQRDAQKRRFTRELSSVCSSHVNNQHVIAHGCCMRNSVKDLFDKGYFNFKTKSTLSICFNHLNIICLCKIIQVNIKLGSQTDRIYD